MPEIKMRSSTFILLIIVIALLVLLLSGTFNFLPFEKVSGLNEVATLISSNYVEKIDERSLVRDGITGMVADLDPYSEFLDKRELEGLLEMSKGEFQGVGMEIAVREDYPTVISPLEGSPAYEAGIQAGDKIIKIDGISAKGFSGEEAQLKIRGLKGSTVRLTILREGIKDSLDFNIKRDVIEIKSVAFSGELEDGIGYVRLTRFSENAPAELKEALEDLKLKKIKGLILDLRGNPGGLLQEAVRVAELFLVKGVLVVEVKGRKDSKKFYSQARPALDKTPLLVLVDFGSASASEIVAGAIQDYDRGLILGDTTFGKGAVQTLFELRDNTALKLTTAKYYIPSGRLIQKDFDDHDNLAGNTEKIGDTLQHRSPEKVFYTEKGREVYGGGGIVPDIIIPDPDFPQLIQSLLQKGYFFDFAVQYSVTHKNIPEDFKADEKILKEFKDYIESKGFEYKSTPESELEKLRETIEEEEKSNPEAQFSDGVEETLNRLSSLLRKRKESEFEKNKEFLKWQIEEAVLTKEFGSSARYKVWARYQEQIKKAIEILKDEEEYERLLSPG
jgi:carboxyl-terminal processing protease